MTSTPESIIEELLALDPSLIPHRAEVERTVVTLLRSKPESHLREEFTRELLAKLQTQLNHRPLSLASPSSPFLSMLPRFFFLGGGAIAGALATFLILTTPTIGPTPTLSPQSAEDAAPITALSREAFGSLGTNAATSARPQSGGGGGGGDMAMGQALGAEKMMIYPPEDFTIIEYRYDGDVTLPEGDIEVLRRRRHSAAGDAQNLFSTSPLVGLLSLNSLGNLQVQQVSLSQPGKEPYSVSLDFLDGSIWINRMTDYKSRPDSNCGDEACFQQYRLKESDMLSMEELVSITRDFIAELGIDTGKYGEPQMLDDWRIFYAQTEDKANYYFPEMQTVVLPFLIDGKPVYEEYGEPYGMNFSVDIRRREVVSVSNLRTHTFDSSAYAGATDIEKLRKVITQGGSAAWYPEGSKKVVASLEASTEVYLHTYQWDEASATSSELFVPALSFAVTDMPTESYSKKRVVVPLAAELVDRLLNPEMNGVPMPLTDGPVMIEPAPVSAEEPKVTE